MITQETAQKLELPVVDTGRVRGVNSSAIANQLFSICFVYLFFLE
jgi:hypothetical protein